MFRRVYCLFSNKKAPFFWHYINPCVQQAEYAVRGVVPTLAHDIQNELKKGSTQYPFNEVTFCNIGNPQQFHQKPITFNREVISCVVNPDLINNQSINVDARNRAQKILTQIISSGSYTHSLGIPLVRQSVAKFIAKADSVPQPPIQDIILTEGASQGVHLIFSTLIINKNDAVMIPIPQYPLYSACISLYGGCASPYYLDESSRWQLDVKQLEKSFKLSIQDGKNVKAIVIINPGNPTGSILSDQTIKKVIEFAVKNRLLIIADEVYRENVYKQDATFVSFRKVLETMSPQMRDQCELASLHSVSKGLLGECGMRGGYLYIHNFNPSVVEQLIKLKSINLCSNSLGQIMVQLMVNPPLQGVSKETSQKYLTQKKALFESLKYRAKIVSKYLNEMVNIKCQEVEGAMYAFPSITFSKKAILAAQRQHKPIDLFYCLEILKNTGIAVVPGGGFRQQPGTYHFRITTLILPQSKLEAKLQDLKIYNEIFHKKYAD